MRHQVLPGFEGTPEAGDPTEITALVSRSEALAQLGDGHADRAATAAHTLRELLSESTTALAHRSEQLSRGYKDLAALVRELAALLRDHGRELSNIQLLAQQMRAEGHLAYQRLLAAKPNRPGLTPEFDGTPSSWESPSYGLTLSEAHLHAGWAARVSDYQSVVARFQALKARREALDSSTQHRLRQLSLGDGLFLSDDRFPIHWHGAEGFLRDYSTLTAEQLQQLNNPAMVHQIWGSLGAKQQQALLESSPHMLGNLDGIPVQVRAEINRKSFARQIESLRAHITELQDSLLPHEAARYGEVVTLQQNLAQREAYLQQLNGGERHLYAFSAHSIDDAVIELIGELSETTEQIFVMVPGTGENAQGFYSNEAQQASEYLVQQATQHGETAAFVYKNAPWVTWGPGRANSDIGFLSELGAGLAVFTSGLSAAQPGTAKARVHVLGHSAGMSVVSAAENRGARFASVTSLGGSFLIERAPKVPWRPQGQTQYRHYQYGVDAINALDAVTNTPSEHPAFVNSVLEPPRALGFQSAVVNHIKVGAGPESNQSVLDDLLQSLRLHTPETTSQGAPRAASTAEIR